MDRLAAGMLIAGVVLVMHAGMLREALADAGPRAEVPIAATLQPAPPVAPGSRSGRILSLVLCLEALRTVPGLDMAPGA